MAPTSPFRTSSDLILEVLKRLGILSVGNPVDPEDYNYVAEAVDSIFRKIAGLEICYVPDPDNIPGAMFSDLADIVAGECATKFGFSGDAYVTFVNKGLGGAMGVEIGAGTAAKSLKIMQRGRPTYEPLRFVNW